MKFNGDLFELSLELVQFGFGLGFIVADFLFHTVGVVPQSLGKGLELIWLCCSSLAFPLDRLLMPVRTENVLSSTQPYSDVSDEFSHLLISTEVVHDNEIKHISTEV